MHNLNRLKVSGFVLASLLFWGCQSEDNKHLTIHPAEVEHIEGSDLSRVILTEKAMERLGIQISEVRTEIVANSKSKSRNVIPYSSIIYDSQGQTWVYSNPELRTFLRHKITVDFIVKDMVILKDGPPVGTKVASVGVAELYGTELGMGH